MPQYAAFLRAVNVGGRIVKMDALRTAFAGMGFTNTQTVIASGNVLFDSAQRSGPRIEQAIEKGLKDALGFTVTTFVRSAAELVELAEHPLVSGKSLEEGQTLFVAFVREKPGSETAKKLTALRTAAEDFRVHGPHVLWLLRGRFSDSALSGPALERTLGVPTTVRNATTVRKMADKFR